jgi:MFS transporter, AAHS family, 3-hydroxyphenylpropionic acid transporter
MLAASKLSRPAAAAPVSGAGMTLILCACSALMEGFDNQSIGVAAPRLVVEFGLSSTQAGVIFSATPFGLFLGAAIGGRVADHIGRKRTLILSLLLFGVFSILTAMSVGVDSLFVARLLTGLGLGGAMPNFISLASESSHAKQRVSIVTLIMAAMPLGGAIAALVSLGAQMGWNWRSIFYVGGSAPIVLGVLMLRLLPGAVATGSSAPAAATQVDSVKTALFSEKRALTTLLLWVSFFFTQLVLLLMLNWLPTLIVGLGFTKSQAAWTAVFFNLGGSLGAGFLGAFHAGEHRGRWVLITYGAITAALAAVASVGKDFAIAAVACSTAGVFIIGAQLILFALAPLYYRTAIRGTGVGAAVALGRLGSVFGPLFAGRLLAGGGDSASVLLAIVPFVVIGGGAAFALTWREQSHE